LNIAKDTKYILSAIIILICEFTFGKYIAIFGAVPMLTLSFCILVSVFEKDFSYLLTISIILGIVSDILQGHGFGTYSIALPLSAFVTYKFRDSIFTSKMLFLIIDAFLLTIFIQLFYWLMHIFDIGSIGFWHKLISVILPTAVYNTIICAIFYLICKKRF